MVKYLSRDEILKWKETITTDDYSGNETMDVVTVEEILDIEPADVVEREKYEMLNEWAVTLRHQLEEAFNRIDELDKLNGNMREKIDKAIKEMERYSTSFEYAERHDLAGAVDYCIGVIQRSVGE